MGEADEDEKKKLRRSIKAKQSKAKQSKAKQKPYPSFVLPPDLPLTSKTPTHIPPFLAAFISHDMACRPPKNRTPSRPPTEPTAEAVIT